jgi:hypothetical protein
MNTKHSTPTRSKSARHNGKAGNDTNPLKKFEVELYFTQHSSAKVLIEAATLEEAKDKAWDIEPDEVDDWDTDNGEVGVLSVDPVEGGQDHD